MDKSVEFFSLFVEVKKVHYLQAQNTSNALAIAISEKLRENSIQHSRVRCRKFSEDGLSVEIRNVPIDSQLWSYETVFFDNKATKVSDPLKHQIPFVMEIGFVGIPPSSSWKSLKSLFGFYCLIGVATGIIGYVQSIIPLLPLPLTSEFLYYVTFLCFGGAVVTGIVLSATRIHGFFR